MISLLVCFSIFVWGYIQWDKARFLSQINKVCDGHDGIYAFPNTNPYRVDCYDNVDYSLLSEKDIKDLESDVCERTCNYVLERADVKGIHGTAFNLSAYYPRGNYCNLFCY